MKPLLLWLFVTFYVAFQISAQQGDASDPAGEKQLERLPAHAIPSAPVLSPDKALKSSILFARFQFPLFSQNIDPEIRFQ